MSFQDGNRKAASCQPFDLTQQNDFRLMGVNIGEVRQRCVNGNVTTISSKIMETEPGSNDFAWVIKDEFEEDRSGLWVAKSNIVGRSWCNILVPGRHYIECANPYGTHIKRICYSGIDGGRTESHDLARAGGVVCLCAECFWRSEDSKKSNKWKRRITHGLWKEIFY